MNLKKSALSENLIHCSAHQRRKIFYGFGVGLLASFFAFFVIFLTDSYTVPLLNPVLQGFYNLGSFNDNSSPSSWSFTFSTTSCISSRCSLHIGYVNNVSSQKVDHMVLTEKGKGDFSKNGGISNLMLNSGTKGGVLGDAHRESKDFSKNLENVSTIDVDVDGLNVTIKNSDKGNRTVNVSHFGPIDKELKLPKAKGGGNLSLNVLSANDSQIGIVQNGFLGDCDIFNGRWIKDYSGPYYPPGSCPYIDRDFNCHLNKRPDDEYLKWKWQPYGCDIPRLNATDFLERLRGKKLVFVGDSLNRNMWESLVCILWQSIPDKTRVYEISGRREFKKNGAYAFKFEDYNCTVDFISSKFLVRESSVNGVNGTFEALRLDMMDQATTLYQDADVLVFNTGHWWTHEKTSKGENYYQEGDYVHPKLKVLEAFKRALVTWAKWVDENIDSNRTKVLFRGYSVTHFWGGRWNSGGQCHTETEPILNETHLAQYPPKMRAVEHVIQKMKTPVTYLNISRLTDFRKDGHPSIYRREYKTVEEQKAAVSAQDCSHWCLPGVPDTWNELLYFTLLNSDRGLATT